MKKKKNVFWGIFFIAAAVLLIVEKQFSFIHISLWTLALTVIFAITLIDSLRKIEWTGILFSLAFLAIIYDEVLHIENLTPWPVLGAALLGSIGMNLLFHKKSHARICVENQLDGGKKEMIEENATDENYKCDCTFSSAVKYVNSADLKAVLLDNTFGQLTVYLDGSTINVDGAYINVDNTFGETQIYLPKEWNVDVITDETFGRVSYIGECLRTGNEYVKVNADTTFGSIVIHFI